MSTQAPEIDGVLLRERFCGRAAAAGEIRRMRITEAHDYDLIGALDAPTEAPSPVAAPPIAFPSSPQRDEMPDLQKRSFPRRPVLPLL